MKERIHKRATAYGVAIGLFLGAAALAFAISSLWTNESFIIENTKGHMFSVDLSGLVSGIEAVPGSEQSVNPTMTNTGTEEMYVFIKISSATYATGSGTAAVYSFTPNSSDWVRVASEDVGEIIYGYGSADELTPVASTGVAVLSGTLKVEVDGLNFAGLSDDDMKVTFTGCAIGTEGESSAGASDVWADYVTVSSN